MTLVGGVLNQTGGGCLNVAFRHLVEFLVVMALPCVVTIPLNATYGEGGARPYAGSTELQQVLKDLAWKLLIAGAKFTLLLNGERLVACGTSADLEVAVDARDLQAQ